MPAFANLAAPAPFQRFVNDQINANTCWDKSLDNEQQELAAHG